MSYKPPWKVVRCKTSCYVLWWFRLACPALAHLCPCWGYIWLGTGTGRRHTNYNLNREQGRHVTSHRVKICVTTWNDSGDTISLCCFIFLNGTIGYRECRALNEEIGMNCRLHTREGALIYCSRFSVYAQAKQGCANPFDRIFWHNNPSKITKKWTPIRHSPWLETVYASLSWNAETLANFGTVHTAPLLFSIYANMWILHHGNVFGHDWTVAQMAIHWN